jgi:hypothetical protein
MINNDIDYLQSLVMTHYFTGYDQSQNLRILSVFYFTNSSENNLLTSFLWIITGSLINILLFRPFERKKSCAYYLHIWLQFTT